MASVTLVVFVVCLGVSKAWLVLNLNAGLNKVGIKESIQSDRGNPLILTPYIESGRINEARTAAKVKPFAGNVKSYSGFFTVDQRYNSTLFFWYFPAELKPKQAPVVVWLQGGPGGSSLYGTFLENGPYSIGDDGNVKLRQTYWSKTMHVIYIDNPVGTGFSFTDSDEGYSRDEISIGSNMHQSLIQFFKMFPELVKNDFYATGESYAGKYVPALSYTIHKNNPSSEIKINLKGLAIGNGLVDPVNQLNYGDYYYQIGLIDEDQLKIYEEAQDRERTYINQNNWRAAFNGFYYINGDLFINTTGFNYVYNYLISEAVDFTSAVDGFLERSNVKKALHVGNIEFLSVKKTRNIIIKLKKDITTSIAPWLSVLADNYKVLIYSGQLDCIIPYPGSVEFVSKLPWCGASALASAERKKWYVKDKLAGYVKTSAPSKCNGSLSLSLVRNAGHMVPLDQPVWAYDLISRFTSNSLP